MVEDKKGIQVIVFPYHGQGHMNTMLQFSKRLAWKGVHVTIATSLSTTLKIKDKVGVWDTIALDSIFDDTDPKNNEGRFKDRMIRFETDASINLAKLLIAKKEESNNKTLLVYDGNFNWALDVAHKHGVRGAAFYPQSSATVSTYYSLYLETQGKDLTAEFPLPPQLPPLELIQQNLPKASGFTDGVTPLNGKEYSPFILWVLRQCTNLDQADMLLFNQFDKLVEDGGVLQWMSNVFNVKTIGPTLPSAYLDKRIENDVDYGFHQYKLDDELCMKWLDTKPAGSVVYVAFGSGVHWTVEQMTEIAEGLKQNPNSFLWIVRDAEKEKLPANYISELSSDKGLVLSWCPQLDVLKHEAIGCFVTHCGWNSITEALSFGVPMLAMPHFLDQPIDAHFVDKVWGAGVTVNKNEDGMVTRDEICRCLSELMQGDRAKQIKEKVAQWKVLAKEALEEGGSTDKHINEIIEWVASF